MLKRNKIKVTFYGGAGQVTGANFLLQEENGLKILFDCGLVQGKKIGEEMNRDAFPYNPAEIDYLFVSHAHIDHIGRIPKLVRDGFHGKIISTPPTKEIAEIMLVDSLGILGKEAKHDNKPPIYDEDDCRKTMELWQEGIPYNKEFTIGNFTVRLSDSGHILGSSMTELVWTDGPTGFQKRKLIYTGDLGNSPSIILRDTELIADADYLIMESCYGDRNHEPRDASRGMLEDTIENTVKRNGALIIPAFSIEKTQEILFEIKRMMEESRIPLIKVFLDSPLAIKVTEVYKKYHNYMNAEAMKLFNIDPEEGLFAFPQLHQTPTTEESIAIKNFANPKIIIAGSGMSNGGRILHHEKNYLPDPNSTLLLTGYQSVQTLGRIIQEGEKSVRIMGETIPVKASVVTITGYSGHKGSDDLLEFVSDTADQLKKAYIVLGEPKSSLYFVQRVRDALAVNAMAPVYGESVILDDED
ncbi:MAG: MBL fold metallo-hydrolase [Candidatus Vogelbacteria bacterium]|nr:MBL fold metallo-hydrolase [Candidatus Vogelbacteria bacterium]